MTTRSGELDFAGLQARIVPLVAELFATLASQNPLRMRFADIANKTLLDIVEVLRQDGMSHEAIAATLGLTINGYHAKLKRLIALYREGEAEGEPSLLERVFAFVDEQAGGRRGADLSRQFRGVKADSLKGVLSFLVRSGFLQVRGRGAAATYQAVNRPRSEGPTLQDVAVTLYREGPLTAADLCRRLGLRDEQCRTFLDTLRAGGRLREVEVEGEPRYLTLGYHVPLDSAEGYEAAIWDHLAAVFRAIGKKVRLGRHAASLRDTTGGATFTFFVAEDDPLWPEISSFLRENRVRLEDWLARARVLAEAPGASERVWKRVTIYVGQSTDDMEPPA